MFLQYYATQTIFFLNAGIRWKVHSPEGTRKGTGRKGQAVYQRVREELR